MGPFSSMLRCQVAYPPRAAVPPCSPCCSDDLRAVTSTTPQFSLLHFDALPVTDQKLWSISKKTQREVWHRKIRNRLRQSISKKTQRAVWHRKTRNRLRWNILI